MGKSLDGWTPEDETRKRRQMRAWAEGDPSLLDEPETTPEPPKRRNLARPEERVQKAIRRHFEEELGCVVIETSRHRKACQYCGRFSRGGDGVDRGCPDLLIFSPLLPRYVVYAMEVKGPTTALSSEQEEMEAGGYYPVVRTVEAAEEGWREFLRGIGRGELAGSRADRPEG